jgi:hypothetical protein
MASFNETTRLNLRAMGFCGADDTVQPELLQLLSIHYTWIEWGVLLRPDMEGQPRYPTWAWVERLAKVNKGTGSLMRLAGHLCKQRCQEVLEGDYTFAKSLAALGFGRLQVNATAANGVVVDKKRYDEYAANLRRCMLAVPEIEWIIQANEETKPIWEKLIVPTVSTPRPSSSASAGGSSSVSLSLPSNMSILYDASCGKGELAATYPSPLTIPVTGGSNAAGGISVPCGYAGGLGPETIESVCNDLIGVTKGTRIWIDMESKLRTIVVTPTGNTDIFDIHKCFQCALIGVTKFGLSAARFSLMSI